MPILKKKPASSQPESQEATSGRKPAKDAFAQKMAETEANEGGNWTPPPVGTYSALVTEAQGVVDGDKTSAYFEVTIVEDEDISGKTCRIYFNFTDENGDEMGGMPYFKQALTMFGIDPDKEITSWDSACDILANIAQENMWCHISVKKKGKYTNVFIDDVPENQDEKPALPE